MIDRDSPVPAYYQIKQDLTYRISRHEWPVGEKIPSEAQLMEEYNVSRVTLRQALAELEKDNQIKRYRGKGAFVTGITPKPFVHDLSYKLVNNDKSISTGEDISAKVLVLATVSPVYPDIRKALNLPEDKNEAVYLKRIFYLEGKPIAIGKSWLPSYLLPRLVEEGLVEDSISRTLEERYHFTMEKADDYVEVVRATQSESTIFNCPLDVPLFLVKGITYIKDDVPMEYSQTVWLGDAVRFHLHFRNTGNGLTMGF